MPEAVGHLNWDRCLPLILSARHWIAGGIAGSYFLLSKSKKGTIKVLNYPEHLARAPEPVQLPYGLTPAQGNPLGELQNLKKRHAHDATPKNVITGPDFLKPPTQVGYPLQRLSKNQGSI